MGRNWYGRVPNESGELEKLNDKMDRLKRQRRIIVEKYLIGDDGKNVMNALANVNFDRLSSRITELKARRDAERQKLMEQRLNYYFAQYVLPFGHGWVGRGQGRSGKYLLVQTCPICSGRRTDLSVIEREDHKLRHLGYTSQVK